MVNPFNFCDLGEELSDPATSQVHVLPVPYECTSSYKVGTQEGPRAIIEASRHLELYDEELGWEPSQVGICTLPEVEPPAGDPEGMVGRIREVCRPIIASGKLLVMIGGEHTISLGAVQGFVERFPDLTVVQLDAHADLRDEYRGSRYSHACVMRRISEIASIVQIGIRSLSLSEAAYLKERPGRIIYAHQLCREHPNPLDLIGDSSRHIYVTMDLDVFDPSVMPSVGTPEPGGLGWYGVMELLCGLAQGRKVVGFDAVELCPQPYNVAPDFTAAKSIYKFIGYIKGSIKNKPQSTQSRR